MSQGDCGRVLAPLFQLLLDIVVHTYDQEFGCQILPPTTGRALPCLRDSPTDHLGCRWSQELTRGRLASGVGDGSFSSPSAPSWGIEALSTCRSSCTTLSTVSRPDLSPDMYGRTTLVTPVEVFIGVPSRVPLRICSNRLDQTTLHLHPISRADGDSFLKSDPGAILEARAWWFRGFRICHFMRLQEGK